MAQHSDQYASWCWSSTSPLSWQTTHSALVDPFTESSGSWKSDNIAIVAARTNKVQEISTVRANYGVDLATWESEDFRAVDPGLVVEIGRLPTAANMSARLTKRFTWCTGTRETSKSISSMLWWCHIIGALQLDAESTGPRLCSIHTQITIKIG